MSFVKRLLKISVSQGNLKANVLEAGSRSSSSRTLMNVAPSDVCGTYPATVQNGTKWFVKHWTDDGTYEDEPTKQQRLLEKIWVRFYN